MVSGTWSRYTRPGVEGSGAGGRSTGPGIPEAPDAAALAALLDEYAPFGPAPLVPEIKIFQGRVLLELWGAAERLAGGVLGPPFWGYPWPGGIALARYILDHAELVAGGRVLDLGTGGGIAALAAARAGGARVVAMDRDPWALTTASLAAERQGLTLDLQRAEVMGAGADVGVEGGGQAPGLAGEYDVVLCADLAYERRGAPGIRAYLEALRGRGARVILADAGRAYFDPAGCSLLAGYQVPVPRDLEGTEVLAARVYDLD